MPRTRWNVEPHVGIGPIRLGMDEAEVRATLSQPSAIRRAAEERAVLEEMAARLEPDHPIAADLASMPAGDTFYFLDNAVQVTFDEHGRIDFVGVSRHKSLDVRYDDVPVFEVEAEDLSRYISCDARPDTDDREYPSNWTFPALELSLYRGGRRERLWKQISVGAKGYFSRGRLFPEPERTVKVAPIAGRRRFRRT